MVSSANTFGTFLETLRKLESSRGTSGRSSESEMLMIAQLLRTKGGSASIGEVRNNIDMSQESFLGAVVSGRDKGLFKIDEQSDDPIVELTKLGSSLAR
jgi:hypothetical protein